MMEKSTPDVPPQKQPGKQPPAKVYPEYSWQELSPLVKLHYVSDSEEADRLLSDLDDQPGPFGFDCEWRPNYTKGERENPVAVVQLANKDAVYLLQVSAMKQFPKKLFELLGNPDIVKSGVGIQNDVKKLYHEFSVVSRNCIDLSLLARSVDNAQWKGKYSNPIGLARLVEAYYQLSLPKGRVQRSNWEDHPLSETQLDYAANDAHAGLVVYNHLVTLMDSMEPPLIKHTPSAISSLTKPVPSRHYYTFDYNSHLVETGTAGKFWNCYNPDYNPGPPPPPRMPKLPKAKDVKVLDVVDGEVVQERQWAENEGGPGALHDLAGRAKRRHEERDREGPSLEERAPESSSFHSSAGPSSRGGPRQYSHGTHWRGSLMQRISPAHTAQYSTQQSLPLGLPPGRYDESRGEHRRGRGYSQSNFQREPRHRRGRGRGGGDQGWPRTPNGRPPVDDVPDGGQYSL